MIIANIEVFVYCSKCGSHLKKKLELLSETLNVVVDECPSCTGSAIAKAYLDGKQKSGMPSYPSY